MKRKVKSKATIRIKEVGKELKITTIFDPPLTDDDKALHAAGGAALTMLKAFADITGRPKSAKEIRKEKR